MEPVKHRYIAYRVYSDFWSDSVTDLGVNMSKSYCKGLIEKLSMYLLGMSSEDDKTVQIRYLAAMTD